MNNKPTIAICVTSLGATRSELKKLPYVLKRLDTYFNVAEPKDLAANDVFDSQSIDERLKSIERAFVSADIVLAYNGGYNSIELFEQFSAIADSKSKIFIGYSDNTLLVNALPVTGKSRGWLGPMAATMIKFPQYIDIWAQNFLNWYNKDFDAVTTDYNRAGMKTLQAGRMSAPVIGGNTYTFDLLQGTPYAPSFNKPFTFVLEGEDFITDKGRVWQDTVRNLDSILLQPGAVENIRGLLIGKFPDTYQLDISELKASINKRAVLKSIPILYDFPRGYGQPSLALPVGEELCIEAFADDTVSINKL